MVPRPRGGYLLGLPLRQAKEEEVMSNISPKIIKRKLLYLVIGLILSAMFISFSGCKSQTVTMTPSTNHPVPEQSEIKDSAPASPPSLSLPITANFTLTTYDEEPLENARKNHVFDHPFNAYGVYMTQEFFLKAGETIEVNIRSNYPTSFEDWSDRRWRLNTTIRPGFLGGLIAYISNNHVTCAACEWLKSKELKRIGSDWEVQAIVSPKEDGFYFLYIENDSGNESPCKIDISLR
jgi:hypothetical protein